MFEGKFGWKCPVVEFGEVDYRLLLYQVLMESVSLMVMLETCF
jgi:hypothetical protein